MRKGKPSRRMQLCKYGMRKREVMTRIRMDEWMNEMSNQSVVAWGWEVHRFFCRTSTMRAFLCWGRILHSPCLRWKWNEMKWTILCSISTIVHLFWVRVRGEFHQIFILFRFRSVWMSKDCETLRKVIYLGKNCRTTVVGATTAKKRKIVVGNLSIGKENTSKNLEMCRHFLHRIA